MSEETARLRIGGDGSRPSSSTALDYWGHRPRFDGYCQILAQLRRWSDGRVHGS